jgi:uncharacterized protein (UPF0548 family)
MHEESWYAAIARMRNGAPEQRTAHAFATVAREDGERDLGKIVLECHMCRADERELIVMDAKDCVAIEINSVDVGGYGCGPERRAETQVPVL